MTLRKQNSFRVNGLSESYVDGPGRFQAKGTSGVLIKILKYVFSIKYEFSVRGAKVCVASFFMVTLLPKNIILLQLKIPIFCTQIILKEVSIFVIGFAGSVQCILPIEQGYYLTTQSDNLKL